MESNRQVVPTITKHYLLKNKHNLLEFKKAFEYDGFRISVYKKKQQFKLKHTNVVSIIPARLVKKATTRSSLRRKIKNYVIQQPWYSKDTVVIAKLLSV